MRTGSARAVLPGVLLAATLLAAGCGQAATTPPATVPPTSAAPTGSPATPGSPATSGPSAPVTLEPAPSGRVAEDDTLLAVLPADLDGLAVGHEPDSFAEAARDPSFVANVEAAAFPLLVDAENLASGVVARLRPGVWSEAFFRDWRDSYDEGACGQAGGVSTTAETDLGGRTVHITSCANGLLVYHAYVASRGVVVSLFSLGPRRFGERLMGGLRD